MDARTARTRRALLEALIALMEEKGFDHISVADLTARAGCNRGTFYLHYKDKYDLLQQSEAELLRGLTARTRALSPQRVSAHQALEEPEPAMLEVFRYLHEEANPFRVLLGPKGDPAFQARLKEILRQSLNDRLVLLQAQGAITTRVPRDFFTAYVASAHVGVIQHWLDTGTTYSPRYMALLMTRVARFWASMAAQESG